MATSALALSAAFPTPATDKADFEHMMEYMINLSTPQQQLRTTAIIEVMTAEDFYVKDEVEIVEVLDRGTENIGNGVRTINFKLSVCKKIQREPPRTKKSRFRLEDWYLTK